MISLLFTYLIGLVFLERGMVRWLNVLLAFGCRNCLLSNQLETSFNDNLDEVFANEIWNRSP